LFGKLYLQMKYGGPFQKSSTLCLLYGTNCQIISSVSGTSWLVNEFVSVPSLSHIKKSSVFSDTTLYSPLKVIRRFGGTCSVHLQSRKMSKARNQHEAVSKESLAYLSTRRWRRHILPKCWLAFKRLHGIIFHTIELFINVRTSDLLYHTFSSQWFLSPRWDYVNVKNLKGIHLVVLDYINVFYFPSKHNTLSNY
jgi:hypothetical protein